jgi:hypothetical protein
MYSAADLLNGGVSPFGHPRINDRSHLPAAFRSVPRPSSPLGAKASTERPCLTHHPNSHTQCLHPRPPARRTKSPHATNMPGQNTLTILPVFNCQMNNHPPGTQGAGGCQFSGRTPGSPPKGPRPSREESGACRAAGRLIRQAQPVCIRNRRRGLSLKGGDPAAGSPTATLLRLHPSH